MGKKILVAFDDSENAMRAVEFIATTLTKDCDITLLSIMPDTAAICDMDSPSLVPYFKSQQLAFCTLEDKKKELVKEAQEKARETLLKAGFDEKKVTTKLATQKKGIAKDIITEATSGYDTIVMGRRGMSGVREFIFGGTSQKILHSLKDMSVILVD
jgi:nucleotide-binding universal stress UspA family protein